MSEPRSGLTFGALKVLFTLAAIVLFILAALGLHPALLAWGLACYAAGSLF